MCPTSYNFITIIHEDSEEQDSKIYEGQVLLRSLEL